MICTRQVFALLAALAVAAPAAAAPAKKAPVKKAPAKKGAKSTAAEEAALERSLGAGAEEAAPAAPPPAKGSGKGPKKVTPPPEAADEAPVSEGPKRKEPIDLDASAETAWHGIDVQVGAGVFSRQLSYTDDIFKALRPYSLPLGPALSLRASVLPLAVGKDLRIGAYLRGDMAVGIESKNPAGQAFASSAGVAEIALAAQMRMDELSLGLRLGYGTQWFSAEAVEGARETIDPGIPSVKHTYLMGTLTGAYAVTPALDLTGAFTYLAGQGAGAMSSAAWFPNASSSGFDVQVGGIYKLSSLLGLGVEANYRRIALTMNSVPGDAKVAGGATDDTPGARVFLNLHW